MREYLKLLSLVHDQGTPHTNRTGVTTRRVIGYQARYDLRDSFPLLTTKHVSLRNVFNELRFFLLGKTDQAWLEKRKCKIWKPWSGAEWCAKQGLPENDLGPIYGFQWRHFGADYEGKDSRHRGLGVDQIARAVRLIQEEPDSRRIVVSAWEPGSLDRMALPPCHVLFQFTVDGDRLHTHLYQRSCDVFLGVPYNVASYSLLTLMMAHVTGLQPGSFIHSMNDAHLYENHLDQAREQLSRSPGPAPHVELSRVEPGSGLAGLLDIKWKDVTLKGYEPQGRLNAPVAV
jgi:thymidylate synthase